MLPSLIKVVVPDVDPTVPCPLIVISGAMVKLDVEAKILIRLLIPLLIFTWPGPFSVKLVVPEASVVVFAVLLMNRVRPEAIVRLLLAVRVVPLGIVKSISSVSPSKALEPVITKPIALLSAKVPLPIVIPSILIGPVARVGSNTPPAISMVPDVRLKALPALPSLTTASASAAV